MCAHKGDLRLLHRPSHADFGDRPTERTSYEVRSYAHHPSSNGRPKGSRLRER